ncbi:hypothetical protein [Ornithinicoccus hortensis]|uniref:Uncharacterized protein n=1 Tax=Ornithinicoccus hortensis TaxID=82346 RepID=A0A542YTT2_9MICO|nr:hypothetical protein [Ornithinicoccus hortensis]TQL51496.1 hypothetical protein FB467_2642 [Ornithinicoccus hortensis]
MRFRAEQGTRWPIGQGWDAWWRLQVGEPGGGADLGVLLPEATGHDLRLVHGVDGRPGARYEVVAPGLTVGAAAVRIGGTDGARTAHLAYRETTGRRRFLVDCDGLEAFRSFAVHSTLRHLGLEVALRREPERLLDAAIELDWLSVRVRAQVVRRATGESLRVRLRVVGRGAWRPVLAPLLTMAAPLIRHGLAAAVAGTADRLEHLDEDPAGTGAPARELRQRALGAEIFRRRFHEVVDTVDRRPWWRRGRRALLTAYEDLPAVSPHWPDGAGLLTFGSWWDEEDWLFQGFVQRGVRRRDRHAEVDRQVDAWLRQQEVVLQEGARARAAAEAQDPGHLELTDELVDLSWLASPWSTVRKMVQLERSRTAPAGAGQDQSDVPSVDTDEEARRFVTDFLREELREHPRRG